MNRFKIFAVILLLLITSTTVLFANMTNSLVIVMTAEIPETTVFSMNAEGVSVSSNARNFSYTVEEKGNKRTLHVVAH